MNRRFFISSAAALAVSPLVPVAKAKEVPIMTVRDGLCLFDKPVLDVVWIEGWSLDRLDIFRSQIGLPGSHEVMREIIDVVGVPKEWVK